MRKVVKLEILAHCTNIERRCQTSLMSWNSIPTSTVYTASNGIAGFHINELYSSWSTLEKMVGNFLEAKKLPETLKTFINTSLAETWEEQGEGVDDIPFMQRRENYTPEYLPKGVILLVAGVDVQDNRLEVEVLGFGLDEENWSVEYEILYGDPSTMDLWIRLDEFLKKKYKRQDGVELSIVSTAIDSGGHYTQAVYSFCRGKLRRRIHAIKGVSGFGKPIWPKRASIRNIGKVPLYTVGVDAAKDIIYKRLKIERTGAGYCHFPMYEAEYFEQLASEKIVFTYHKGVPVRKFVSTRARNEALDCRVYAYAAFVGLQPDLRKVEEKQKKVKEEHSSGVALGNVKKEEGIKEVRAVRKSISRPLREGFVNSWKKIQLIFSATY